MSQRADYDDAQKADDQPAQHSRTFGPTKHFCGQLLFRIGSIGPGRQRYYICTRRVCDCSVSILLLLKLCRSGDALLAEAKRASPLTKLLGPPCGRRSVWSVPTTRWYPREGERGSCVASPGEMVRSPRCLGVFLLSPGDRTLSGRSSSINLLTIHERPPSTHGNPV